MNFVRVAMQRMSASRLALVVVLLFTAYLRFYGVTEDGLRFPDDFFYSDRATDWLNGRFTLQDAGGFTFIRPVQFALDAVAQAVFGVNDYAISIAHGLLDLCNVLLIASLASHFAGSPWAGIGAALLYVGSEKVAMFNRTNFGHGPGATFLLLAFSALVFSGKGFANWRAVASGLALGLGAGIRPEFACFAPGFAIAWPLSHKSWRTLPLFIGGFAAPFLAFNLAFGWRTVTLAIAADRATEGSSGTMLPGELTIRILTSGIADMFSWPFTVLWVLGLVTATKVVANKHRRFLGWCALHTVFFALTFDLLVTRRDVSSQLSRVLIPMGTFVVIFVGVWAYAFALSRAESPVARRRQTTIYVLFCLVLGLAPVVRHMSHVRGDTPHPQRRLTDLLKGRVNEEARVLIAPLNNEPYRRFFSNSLYLGTNAVYLLDCVEREQPLREFLVQEKIRFVYIADPWPNAWWPLPAWLGNCFGSSTLAYSPIEEEEILKRVITERGGQLIFQRENFGRVYGLESAAKDKVLVLDSSLRNAAP